METPGERGRGKRRKETSEIEPVKSSPGPYYSTDTARVKPFSTLLVCIGSITIKATQSENVCTPGTSDKAVQNTSSVIIITKNCDHNDEISDHKFDVGRNPLP